MAKILHELPFVGVTRSVIDRPSLSVEVEGQTATLRKAAGLQISVDKLTHSDLLSVARTLELDDRCLEVALMLRRNYRDRLKEVSELLRDSVESMHK